MMQVMSAIMEKPDWEVKVRFVPTVTEPDTHLYRYSMMQSQPSGMMS